MFGRDRDAQIARFHQARDSAALYTLQGKWRAAVRANMRAERIALKLQRSEPRDPQHIWVIGATCYNQALLWEQLGMGRQAVKAAFRAHDAYRWLAPLDRDPSELREILRSRGDGPAEPAVLIARTADARARLARLLAAHQDQLRPEDAPLFEEYGGSVRNQADVLAHTAVRLYEVLIENGHYGQEDLDRVKKQQAATVEHLYGRH